jgi:hypothetical protein
VPIHVRVEDPGTVAGNPVFSYLDARLIRRGHDWRSEGGDTGLVAWVR